MAPFKPDQSLHLDWRWIRLIKLDQAFAGIQPTIAIEIKTICKLRPARIINIAVNSLPTFD